MQKQNENEPGKSRPPKISAARARKEFWKSKVVEHYLKGGSYQIIQQTLQDELNHKFSQSFITKAIREAIEKWKASKADMVEAHKAIELEKINRLEFEYWKAWENSCNPTTSKSTEKTSASKAAATPEEDQPAKRSRKMAVSKVTESQRTTAGDSKFLDGIYKCVEIRCRILGLEAPVKTETTNTTTVIRRTAFVVRPLAPVKNISENDSDAATG